MHQLPDVQQIKLRHKPSVRPVRGLHRPKIPARPASSCKRFDHTQGDLPFATAPVRTASGAASYSSLTGGDARHEAGAILRRALTPAW